MAVRTSLLRITPLIAASCGFTLIAGLSHAQQREHTPEPTIAVVTGDNVHVRSGAADSFYPFGRLNRGDLVEVTGEKFNWARISTRGPSFPPGAEQGQFFGYIIYPKNETNRFRINSDGKTGVTLGRMDVLAPNLNTNFNPDDSWKPLARLEADVTVTILATSTTQNNTVHRIVLPKDAEAWISKAYLRDATGEEIDQWKRAISGKKGEPAKQAPAERKPAAAAAKKEDTRPVVAPRPEREERPVAPKPADEKKPEPVREVVMGEEAKTQTKEDAAPEKGAEPTLAEQVAAVTLDDLEDMMEDLRRQPAEIAEVAYLRQMYLDLAARERERRTVRFARARAEQLAIWEELRERKAELERIRARAEVAGERTETAILAVYAHADYDAIGRLTASTIYDGKRLPRMLRLMEPGTGRTLAYIQPEVEGFNMVEMIGQWVGMVAERSYDPALRLNILTPKRIDLLTPQQ